MKLFLNAKGQANIYSPLLGVILVAGLVFYIWYHNDHKDDITIHPPHIDVH